ncbi:MAG: DUF4974 domain-containing protein [Bacteroidota bacterium]|nr:DUF4974 domain-containing protein [Bacteroidota bacterium]
MSSNETEKLTRFINGTSSPEEEREITEIMAGGENNPGLKNLLEDDWNKFTVSNITTGINLTPVLDRIHHRISLNEHAKSRSLGSKISSFYSRVAAIILIPLLSGAGFLLFREIAGPDSLPSTASIHAPAGARVSFTLPDGSGGMLNSGSTLTYQMPFTKERSVILEGEAWFDVARDEKHPFTVDAGSLDLTVVGTAFNVNAYPDEDYVEVVLESGKVLVNCGQYKEGMVMSPSERIVYENGRVTRSTSDPSKYSSWTKGKLVFRSDSMSEVARRIERWYNVKVELMDDDLEKYSFRATFEDDPLEEVLKFLSMTSPIRYEITPRYIAGDSTYAKSTVKIYLK